MFRNRFAHLCATRRTCARRLPASSSSHRGAGCPSRDVPQIRTLVSRSAPTSRLRAPVCPTESGACPTERFSLCASIFAHLAANSRFDAHQCVPQKGYKVSQRRHRDFEHSPPLTRIPVPQAGYNPSHRCLLRARAHVRGTGETDVVPDKTPSFLPPFFPPPHPPLITPLPFSPNITLLRYAQEGYVSSRCDNTFRLIPEHLRLFRTDRAQGW